MLGYAGILFSPDGQTLAWGGAGLHLWDVSRRCERSFLKVHSSPVRSLAFSPDGGTLAVGSSRICLLDPRSGQESFLHEEGPDRLNAVAASTSALRTATAGAGGAISLWALRTGAAVGKLSGHDDDVLSLASSPDGR